MLSMQGFLKIKKTGSNSQTGLLQTPENMSSVLRDLHWLKIDESIDYKVLLQIFKCLFDEGPVYLLRDFEMLSSIPGKQT